jgi:hypothetical protein
MTRHARSCAWARVIRTTWRRSLTVAAFQSSVQLEYPIALHANLKVTGDALPLQSNASCIGLSVLAEQLQGMLQLVPHVTTERANVKLGRGIKTLSFQYYS